MKRVTTLYQYVIFNEFLTLAILWLHHFCLHGFSSVQTISMVSTSVLSTFNFLKRINFHLLRVLHILFVFYV